MPKVKRQGENYVIVSHYRGRFITHTLTDDGAHLLAERIGSLEGTDVDVGTLMWLKEGEYALTRRQAKRKTKPLTRKKPTPAPAPSTPRPVPPPAPIVVVDVKPIPPPAGLIACPGCGNRIVSTATYCGRCGAQLTDPPAPAMRPAPVKSPAWTSANVLLAVLYLAMMAATVAILFIAFR